MKPWQPRIVGSLDRDVTVAVVIPTFNEADNIREVVRQLFALDVEKLAVLFVDDSSPDGTGEIADELAAQHPGRILVAHRTGKLGLGTAYISGFRIALDNAVQRVVQMDCDLSHPPTEIPAMLNTLEYSDVVVGTRYSGGGDLDPNWKMSRVLLSKWANFGIRTVLGLRIHDATGGFKAYREDALKAIAPDSLTVAGFGFQAEVAYRVQQCGLTVSEHPYTFMERTTGKSKMSLHIAVEALWRLTLLRLTGR